MDNDPEPVTAEMLDRMSPNERASAFNARIIRGLEQLPPHFRDDVTENARRLSEERQRRTDR